MKVTDRFDGVADIQRGMLPEKVADGDIRRTPNRFTGGLVQVFVKEE